MGSLLPRAHLQPGKYHICVCDKQSGRSTEIVCRQGENLLVTREDLLGASTFGLSVRWKVARVKKAGSLIGVGAFILDHA